MAFTTRSAFVTCALKVLLVGMVSAAVEGGEVESASPFGVVCPWPGVERAGVQWCRVGAGATALADWPGIEKTPGTWDWTAADNEITQFADPLGLSLLPIFGYTPQWASRAPDDSEFRLHPPKEVAHFARFVGQCVARYKQRVKVWEVWNEPNIGFFHGSAAEYAEMVKAAAVAARRADPDCRIAMGCAGVDLDFLERLYEFGCGPYFDVMSVHPYQWGRELNDGWMVDKLQGCRELMDRYGDEHKEIWITEIGWSLAEGITSQEQANLLAQAMVTALSVRERLRVAKVFWFSVKDWGGPGHGLLDVAGEPKPALFAYQAVTTTLNEARYQGPWEGPAGTRGHVFERAGQPVLVAWNPSADGKMRIELRTSASKLSLRTVDSQTSEVPVSEGRLAIELSHAPLFITGLTTADLEFTRVAANDTTVPAPAREELSEVWLSILPPTTTARPFLVSGGYNEVPVRVHNDGSEPARGELKLELAGARGVLASGQVPFDVAPGSLQTVLWRVTPRPDDESAGELARLHIEGAANDSSLAPIDLPVRLVRCKAIEFAANSFVEQQYLHKAEQSGCSESIRFGSEFGYRFDLRNMRAAQLRINVGANGANPWNLLVSKDDREYVLECSGKSWPSWQSVALGKYLGGAREAGGNVYVKIQGTDCQVREVVLEAEAEEGVRPVPWKTYHKSPSELIVYDARPELGIGMHAIDDESISLVRKLGIRFVRHTMYWYLIENTTNPGQYDEAQLRAWDDLVLRCQQQGVVPVVVVHGNAPGVTWADREAGYLRFARFMGDMAHRYPQIRYWELWNEMDGAFTDLFGAGQADISMRERGKLYARMLQLVYPQIRKANPDAWVLTGGMTDWNEFPRGIYEGGGRESFDIMALHSYGVPVEWAFSARGLQLRRLMEECGDADKPLWNTEFGIDAGNIVGAWGYPHARNPQENDAVNFDQEQLRQWQACLASNRELGLYAKILPYQFAAGNERDDDQQIRQRSQLPPDLTIDDFGFGIMRRDGRTPRPTYQWLLQEQVNRGIEEEPAYEVDIVCRPAKDRVPVGYDYTWEGEDLIIRRVRIDRAYPTRIELRERDSS
ncbi:MAG: cellulase family glycosylhydrolase [Pirellulaceae bacterium]